MKNHSQHERRPVRSCSHLLSLALVMLAWAVTGCASPKVQAPELSPREQEAARLGVAASDAERLETIVQTMLDREALYTLAPRLGADPDAPRLKPISSGFWQHKINVADPGPGVAEMNQVRALLERLNLPGVWVGVVPFAAEHGGNRHVEAYVVHRPTLDAILERHAGFFARWGLTPGTDPGMVITVVEFMPRLDRFRGYGYLFGYPDEAVDFFVEAARQGEAEDRLIPRDFRSVAVFESPTNRFVWAVPKDAAETEAEAAIRTDAEAILAGYRLLREATERGGGALDLVRRVNAGEIEAASQPAATLEK